MNMAMLNNMKTKFFSVTKLSQVKRLCQTLGLNILKLFDIPCAYCEQDKTFEQDYLLPRNILIRKKRIELDLSEEELGDRIGFESEAIHDMEHAPDYLDEWSFDYIKELASVLGVPIQILLAVKCIRCGR